MTIALINNSSILVYILVIHSVLFDFPAVSYPFCCFTLRAGDSLAPYPMVALGRGNNYTTAPTTNFRKSLNQLDRGREGGKWREEA